MFFSKKKITEKPDEKPENVARKGIKTMDTVVTGVILGGIIASLYGVKKLRNKDTKKVESHEDTDIHK